jgi:hypothetical protein
MMMWFIDVLRIILTQCDDFERCEHAFLGGWIDRYLLECTPNKTTILTSVLLKVFERCSEPQSTNITGIIPINMFYTQFNDTCLNNYLTYCIRMFFNAKWIMETCC